MRHTLQVDNMPWVLLHGSNASGWTSVPPSGKWPFAPSRPATLLRRIQPMAKGITFRRTRKVSIAGEMWPSIDGDLRVQTSLLHIEQLQHTLHLPAAARCTDLATYTSLPGPISKAYRDSADMPCYTYFYHVAPWPIAGSSTASTAPS